MEKIKFSEERKNARLANEFYYSLVWLQTKAVGYVARGENAEDKRDRMLDVIATVKDAGVKIPYTDCDDTSEEFMKCQIPPCEWDETLCMCKHPLNS